MIVSDKYEFVIANPPKTGTTSLHALVDRWGNVGGSSDVLRHLRGESRTRHRLAPPEGKEHYARYMMSRDPRGRLISMYEFLRLRTTDQKWVAPQIQAAEAVRGREAAWLFLLDFVLDWREEPGYMRGGLRGVHGSQPYMWCDLQSEMLAYMAGHDVDGSELPWGPSEVTPLRLEHWEEDWLHLCEQQEFSEGVDLFNWLPRRNAVPDHERLFKTSAEYWGVAGGAAHDRLLAIVGGSRGLAIENTLFG